MATVLRKSRQFGLSSRKRETVVVLVKAGGCTNSFRDIGTTETGAAQIYADADVASANNTQVFCVWNHATLSVYLMNVNTLPPRYDVDCSVKFIVAAVSGGSNCLTAESIALLFTHDQVYIVDATWLR
uniref:Uncharacterized protein n=1 Tax=Peronospora matthiolae TaxID=2874970 RepID=A0AAV1UE07_9STRA